MKGDDGFSCSRSHGNEQPPLPFQDGLDGAVNGDLLVIALALPDAMVTGGQQAIGGLCVVYSARRAVTLPEFIWRRIIRAGYFQPREIIELDNVRAVRRIRELKAKHFCIVLGLLSPSEAAL